MRVVSVNVGGVREVAYRSGAVATGIHKRPASGRLRLGTAGLAGDAQADLRVHGGPDRAVYLYPAGDLAWWEGELGAPVPPGTLGENLTVSGLADDGVHVGDLIRIGDAVVQPTGPREPCFKLGIRMGDPAFPERFRRAGRTGFYARVVEAGSVAAGDPVAFVARDAAALTIRDVHLLFTGGGTDGPGLRRALAVSALPGDWRTWCERRLEEAGWRAARGAQ